MGKETTAAARGGRGDSLPALVLALALVLVIVDVDARAGGFGRQ